MSITLLFVGLKKKAFGWVVGGVTPTEVSSLNNESGVSPLLCPVQAILQSVCQRQI